MPPQDAETTQWFATQIQPHESALRRYLLTLTPESNVDDLVQETYVRLLRSRAKEPTREPRGLLFAIARNAARDIFRREKVAQTTAVAEIEDIGVLDNGPTTPEVVSRLQEIEILEAAIQSLPDRCRTVLILRKFNGLSHKEIANRLGITVHTVEGQLTKALARCENYFGNRGAMPAKGRR